MGTVDEKSVKGDLKALKVDAHIFVGEGGGAGRKSGWYELPDDGVMRFEGFPAGEDDRWKEPPATS